MFEILTLSRWGKWPLGKVWLPRWSYLHSSKFRLSHYLKWNDTDQQNGACKVDMNHLTLTDVFSPFESQSFRAIGPKISLLNLNICTRKEIICLVFLFYEVSVICCCNSLYLRGKASMVHDELHFATSYHPCTVRSFLLIFLWLVFLSWMLDLFLG